MTEGEVIYASIIHQYFLMPERHPTPISHGIEIQKNKVEELQRIAVAHYRSLATISKVVEEKIDNAVSAPSVQKDAADLGKLFEQKHTLDALGAELEDIILRAFEQRSGLHERLATLEERLRDHGII